MSIKQTIKFRRVETVTLRVEVLQELSPEAAAEWAQRHLTAIGLPRVGELQEHTTTDWSAQTLVPKAQSPKRKWARR